MRLVQRHLFTILSIILLLLVTVACSQNDNGAGQSPSAIASTSPASPAVIPQQSQSITKDSGISTALRTNQTGAISTRPKGTTSTEAGAVTSSFSPDNTAPGGTASFTHTSTDSPNQKQISQALKVIAEIPLPGSTSRLDYQSLDLKNGLLFIAHLGDSSLVVVDIRTNKVVTEIKGLGGIHGVIVVPELGRLFVTATSDHQVVVIDEASFSPLAHR